MEVKLSEKAAAIVAEQVAKGWYGSHEEAVEAAVAMLCENYDIDDVIERNRNAIDEGLAEVANGETEPLPDGFFDELRRRVSQRSSH
jgi:Arc/MetJ-type ribon-helix-helix transcriptional regulator